MQFSSVPAIAQYDTVAVDTVQYEPPAEADDYTDDEEESTDDEIYFKDKRLNDGLPITQRKVPDSVTKSMQEEDAFWYANATIEKEKVEEKQNKKHYTPLGQQEWFKTLIWIVIVAGFAAAIIWYLADSNVGLFRKKNKVEQAVEEDIATEDIFAINYQKEIDKAAAQRNYRLAIRLMYLRLLKNMSERNIISYKNDKTNFDYLLQLHSTNYYKDFFRITRNYEYTWYGQFEVNEEAYTIVKNDFEQFERNLVRS